MNNPLRFQAARIDQLLAEKDRLINEKDALVVSKDRLWQRHKEIVDEKDEKIDQLRRAKQNLNEENSELRGKVRALQSALEDLLERNDDDAKSEDAASRYAESEDEVDSKMGVHGLPGDFKDGHDLQSFTPRLPSPDLAGLGSCLFTFAKSTQITSEQKDIGNGMSRISSSKFTFTPLIRLTDDGTYEFGNVNDLADSVINSIGSTLDELDKRHLEKKVSAHPSPQFSSQCCAWNWITCRRTPSSWTTVAPRVYTCMKCFNAKRACLLWIGKMTWMVLPLPPEVRGAGVTSKDAGYYIDPGSEKAAAFPGIWQGKGKAKKRKLDDLEIPSEV